MYRSLTAFAALAALLLTPGLAACQGGSTADPAPATPTSSASAAASQTAPPETAVATPTAQTVSAMDIKVGDCLIYGDNSTSAGTPAATGAAGTPPATASATTGASEGTESDGTVASATLVDCASPHLYEVYAEGTISADGFPVGNVMEQYVADICYNAFESYVGISYNDAYSQGRYAVTSLRPTKTTWQQGDRKVSCILTSVDGSELTGSARGTGS
ncbi:septum formation family protein [Actinomyces sp.]|uniref:septum formation family protein n=1 Tax=Actinomyces sp. TaxID=29317 RepID=UPI0026DD7C62|nr:septum formation family protein [Actinomyces sp.]MDO4900183.1 septum formation family protein [Actinomyces sp.]